MHINRYLLLPAAIFLFMIAPARAENLTVTLPPGMKATAAVANDTDEDLKSQGQIDGQTIHFTKLLTDASYDVAVTLTDGTVLQGVNMHWYDDEADKPNAAPFDSDDRDEITQIMNIKSFYNKSDILMLHGNHDRVTILAQLIRDSQFHSDKGDEVIWRVELWYFKNEHGGWVKISQVNKVLRRERYKSHAEYEKALSLLKWMPSLGGITLQKGKDLTIKVPAATTRPATQPAQGN